MWHKVLLLAAGLASVAGPAYSDSRFFCSADDRDVSFTVESGFDEAAGRRLNHFRGALLIKDEAVPEIFRKRVFESFQLFHHWIYDGELRLEVYDSAEQGSTESLNLVVIAGQRGKSATAFAGTYDLQIAGGAKPFMVSGKVSCGVK